MEFPRNMPHDRPPFGYSAAPPVPYIPRFPFPQSNPLKYYDVMWYANVGQQLPPVVYNQPGRGEQFYNNGAYTPQQGSYAANRSRPGIYEPTDRAVRAKQESLRGQQTNASLSSANQTGTSNVMKYSSLYEADIEFCDDFKKIFIQMYWKMYTYMEPTPFNHSLGELSTLCKDIWRSYSAALLLPKTYIDRISFWKELHVIINEQLGMCQLKTIGSTVSGLAIEDSNFNLHLKGAEEKDDSILLQSMQQVLKRLKEVTNLTFFTEPVPLLSFTVLRKYPFKSCITCNNSNTIITTRFVYAFVQCDWRVQPLFYAIKTWAIRYNILQEGCLNGFHLTLLLIHFLQCGLPSKILPDLLHLHDERRLRESLLEENQLAMFNYTNSNWRSLNTMTLSQLLIRFLIYYEQFDFKKNIISIRFGEIHSKKSYLILHNTHIDEDVVFIEEPAAETNTARHVCLSVLKSRIKYGASKFLGNFDFSKRLNQIDK